MNAKLKTLLCSLFCLLAAVLSGCQESQKAQTAAPDVRRAQLVAHENIQLKQQTETLQAGIADRDRQIADLAGQLAHWQKEAADRQARYAELEKNMNAALQDCQTALAAAQQQAEMTAAPPAEAVSCEELEARYAETFETLMQHLADCATKLEKYEKE